MNNELMDDRPGALRQSDWNITKGHDMSMRFQATSRESSTIRQALECQGSAERLRALYGNWAKSYNSDLAEKRYHAPQAITTLLLEAGVTDRQTQILDAGCGTGFVGLALADHGFECIDGFDLSDEMVAIAAETDTYRHLAGGIDLNQPLEAYESKSYDVVTSAGVFTLGHVSPPALKELLRLVRPGGLIALSTRDGYGEYYGFPDYIDTLIAESHVTLVKRLEGAPYVEPDLADYWVLRVC